MTGEKAFVCPSHCSAASECAEFDTIVRTAVAADPAISELQALSPDEVQRHLDVRDHLIGSCAVFREAVIDQNDE